MAITRTVIKRKNSKRSEDRSRNGVRPRPVATATRPLMMASRKGGIKMKDKERIVVGNKPDPERAFRAIALILNEREEGAKVRLVSVRKAGEDVRTAG